MNIIVGTHYLPAGFRLNEFEIIDKLGEGGFSIVYLAWDHSLERQVALKEYMPSAVASRSHTSLVSVRSENHRETFDIGLKSFINESKLLAQFDHPALVKVYRFWEANGTAYMAMPLYRGSTLKEMVSARSGPPDEKWLMDLLTPLTAALSVIHAKNCFHRDIAPDNIIILDENLQPLLLDFGAARRVIGNMTQSLTVILKPGYAPIEQYSETPGLTQGPWTDVYALGATVHWAITGKPPPVAVGRIVSDSYLPLTDVAGGKYGAAFLQAIDRTLNVLPAQRTPSIEAFRRDLGISAPSVSIPNRWVDPEATVVRDATKTDSIPGVPGKISPDLSSPSLAAPIPAAPHPSTWSLRTPLILGALAALTIAGIAVFYLLQKPQERPKTPESSITRSTEEVPHAPQKSVPENPLAPATPEKKSAVPSTPSDLPSMSEPFAVPAAPAQPAAIKKESPAPASRTARSVASEAPATAAKVERKKAETGDSAECARLMTQLSLGDNNPAIAARLHAIKCR